MDIENVVITDDELQHWGIQGMKWGVRRYQNKDGSLTAAGRKRYDAEKEKLAEREKVVKRQERNKAKIDKLAAKKAELDAREAALKPAKKTDAKNKKGSSEKPKSVKDMTNEELQEYTKRMIAEKNYYDAQNNLAAANPRRVSAGEKFMNGLINDVVVPAAKNAGRAWLEDTLKNKFGLNAEDELTRLKKQHDKLDVENKIRELEKKARKANEPEPEKVNYDELLKKQQYERNKANEGKPDYDQLIKEQALRTAKANADKAEASARQTAQTDQTLKQISSGIEKLQTSIEKSSDSSGSKPSSTKTLDLNKSTNVSRGETFVDSHGNKLFTTSSTATTAGQSFVDSHGNVLFTWGEDDD